MQTIGGYEAISGQKINVQKCGFLAHDKLPSYCMARVRRATGFGHKSFPVRYLGCPLFTRRRKSVYFMEMVQSVINKIFSWRFRFLSSRGRLILIRHVLSAIPTHLLAASCPPRGVLALAEWAMANFLWEEREGEFRHHWIKWEDLCAGLSQGGIGIHSLLEVQSAFSLKLCHSCMVGAVQGSSYCNFWFDNWLGSGPLCQRLQSVSDHPVGDFVLNGRWNQQLLRALGPG
ncbi:unnamed protein product [Coffea canephora]|uniref:DH200=94 genomic scaffold, scaffold_164 n=1 Tax=Coffea canephora TaxID=49390 RepID=A0A068VA83_COFCA|nr:unnamed protein product [Coffea canephora]